MSEQEHVREPASSPCGAPPGFWDGDSAADVCPTLQRLWERLLGVRRLTFVSRSASKTGWNGEGSGSVVVLTAGSDSMTFTESGGWCSADGRESRFRNVFRWSKAGTVLRLEHLRFGEERPVYLFDLTPVSDKEWTSASPHLCRDDCYAAALTVHDDRLVLRWSVTGPRKHEDIEYAYSG